MAEILPFLPTANVDVLLSPEMLASLGVADPATIFALVKCELTDGWLIADYRSSASEITRFAIPAAQVMWAKQVIPDGPPVTQPIQV